MSSIVYETRHLVASDTILGFRLQFTYPVILANRPRLESDGVRALAEELLDMSVELQGYADRLDLRDADEERGQTLLEIEREEYALARGSA